MSLSSDLISPSKGPAGACAWSVFSDVFVSVCLLVLFSSFLAPEMVYPSSCNRALIWSKCSTSCRRYNRCLDFPRKGLITENSVSQYRSTWGSTPTRSLTSPMRKYTLSGICWNSDVARFTSSRNCRAVRSAYEVPLEQNSTN